jgi:hypothetical protein
MTQSINPEKIAQLLTKSTQHLNKATLSALANSRENALQRQGARAPAFSLASHSAHTSARWGGRLISHATQIWIATGLLAIVLLAGTSYWQHVQEQQNDDTDVAILTGDLPIDVFVN